MSRASYEEAADVLHRTEKEARDAGHNIAGIIDRCEAALSVVGWTMREVQDEAIRRLRQRLQLPPPW